MLYLVISSPQPSRPSEVVNSRLEFRAWIEDIKKEGILIHSYPRVGRGFVAIMDVDSNESLHLLLTHWSDIVPASFEIYPLVSVDNIGGIIGKT